MRCSADRLSLRQPLRGHRVGHDAILLAAATAAGAGEHAVDLGAGVGAAGLAVARRVDGLAVTLVEIDPALAALAHENAARNGLAERVRAVCLDVAAPAAAFAAAGLASGAADQVLINPPFNARRKIRRRIAAAAWRMPLRPIRSAMGAHRGAAASARRRADADLARRRARCECWRRSTAGFGAVALLPVHPKPGGAGDPRAGARRQGKPRAARAVAGLRARR